jgi:hypothetical protein
MWAPNGSSSALTMIGPESGISLASLPFSIFSGLKPTPRDFANGPTRRILCSVKRMIGKLSRTKLGCLLSSWNQVAVRLVFITTTLHYINDHCLLPTGIFFRLYKRKYYDKNLFRRIAKWVHDTASHSVRDELVLLSETISSYLPLVLSCALRGEYHLRERLGLDSRSEGLEMLADI